MCHQTSIISFKIKGIMNICYSECSNIPDLININLVLLTDGHMDNQAINLKTFQRIKSVKIFLIMNLSYDENLYKNVANLFLLYIFLWCCVFLAFKYLKLLNSQQKKNIKIIFFKTVRFLCLFGWLVGRLVVVAVN